MICSGCGKVHLLGNERALALTQKGAKASSWLRLSSWIRRNGK